MGKKIDIDKSKEIENTSKFFFVEQKKNWNINIKIMISSINDGIPLV